ncbi:SDR family NAD(P)-dependent oxidoreductase [Chelatococcus composti]|jgi:Dehydrogenases with different specificities (related to short-chain alcohol dehydrogenases)|uniref:3-oxoacyl-[acyl-carrier protein] reductase n=1 Tax=Chelatococcus composti TaxID=1743235 RepID=A0A841KC79_9HYPH|nr:SDR family NAD(P)-dependent oxidoreductase [Chelatococcus composti]MBB6169800.1 3-oxoacyl-[acyl-carrier protein] reductase [Chelatococcus composti]MBS7736229.1 SDR family oxidoreductase [Chelatococcus composti]PZN46348.1 MAG: 3-oxoacyl-ACP reductase [Pseudomonadota bacterium]GGG49750.1 dehydrogenase [Chelatococcus composti]
MNRYDLAGRTAIVTGGAGGIGRAIASAFIASGAHVCLWDRNETALAAAVSDLGSAAEQRVLDITDAAAVEAAARDCHARWGRIDILVNNAGILGEVKPVWETDPENFRRVLEVNLFGAYLVTRAVVGLMRGQEARPMRGHVVNVASIQGKEGMPRAGAYSASKAGLIALTKTVAKETAEEAISVTCITPAAAETSMAKEITSERRAEILARIPMRRFVEVEEIARLVLWLSSDDCSFSTGGIFDISGGRATY